MAKKICKIDVSVIIINFNSYELTKQTLTTLEKFAEGFVYEVIIVDNNSLDGSGKKLEKEFSKYIFILNKENKGFGKANNQALRMAKGKYILFLNNDIIFIENTIGKLLEYNNAKNEKILIAPRLLNADKSIQFSVYSFQTLWLSFTTYFFLSYLFPKSKYFNKYYLINKGISKITEVETITGAFMLFRKKDIIELNGFDEDFFFFGEDNDLCKRFRDSGGKVIYFPSTEIIHLKGGTKKSNWFKEKNSTLSMLKLFDKHYSRFSRKIAYSLMFLGNILRSLLLFIKSIITLDKDSITEMKHKLNTLKIIWNRL